MLSILAIPVLVLVGLEAIYVTLILGIDPSEVSIPTLQLSLIFLFCSLVNASYLGLGVWQQVGESEQTPETSKEQFVVHAGTTSRATEIFPIHETWADYPYVGDFIPVMAHPSMHLGATFYPFQSATTLK